MYVNQIDDLFGTMLDNFNILLVKEGFFKKILSDMNFIKYQNDILKIIQKFKNSLSHKEILSITKNEKYVDLIINIITRYCAFYIYLGIAYYYKGNHSLFITNLIESSKYQKDSTIQIDNFFNSENNSKIIQYFYDIKNLLDLFEFKTIDKIKILLQNNPLKYESTTKIFNDLGEDYVSSYFLIKDNFHNIIKTFIVRYIYINEEKNDIIKLLNQTEIEKGEYKYIDIIVSNKKGKVSFNIIQKLLPEIYGRTVNSEHNYPMQRLQKGLAEDIYDYLLDFYNNSNIIIKDTNEYINYLFSSKILIPITDDFLRFHRDSEKYDVPIENMKERDSTKIKYIMNKITNVINYNSTVVNNNPKLKQETFNLFYKQLEPRKVITYNDNEELKIIQKLDQSKDVTDYDLSLDLKNIRKYAYTNFKNFSDHGFNLRVNSTIDCIRLSNLSNTKPMLLETRIGHDNIDMNVVGVAYNPNHLILDNIKSSDLVNASKNNTNGYSAFTKILNTYKNKIYYWIFSKNDIPKSDKYVDFNVNDHEHNIKIMLEQIYFIYIDIIKNKFNRYIDKLQELSLFDLDLLLKKYNINNLKFQDRNELIVRALNKVPEYEVIPDETDSLIPGKGSDIIILPSVKIKKTTKSIIKLGYTEIDVSLELSNKIIPICHHYIKWDNINKLSKHKIDNFSQYVFDFVKQYVKENKSGDYICKSCNEMLYLQKYVYSGSYNESTDEFLTTSLAATEKFEDNPKYSKFLKVIKNIEKNIEKIASNINLAYYIGNDLTTKLRRKVLIKDTIDLLLLHSEWLKSQPKNRNEEYNKKYNTNLTNLFYFELKDDIFLTSSTDTDQYKIIKYNNIIAYLVFIIISELNFGQIIGLKEDKKYNYFVYKKFGNILFSNLYLRINQKDKIEIKNIPILSYLLYYISGILIDNHIWLWNASKIDVKNKQSYTINIQKNIIHTVIDIMNTICEINFETKKNYLYEIISTRFFIDKLRNIYGDKALLKRLEDDSMKHIQYDEKTNKMTFIKKKIHYINININFESRICKTDRCSYSLKKLKMLDYKKQNNELNSLSNCPDGKFHNWQYKTDDLICNYCKQSYNDLMKIIYGSKNSDINSTIYLDKLRLFNLRKLAKKYCISGNIHDIHDNICSKCNVDINNISIPDSNLYKLEKNIEIKSYEESIEQINILNKKNKLKLKETETIDNIISTFIKSYSDINIYIDTFINRLTKIVGNKINNIFIRDTIYIIDHDYLGNILKKSIIILASANKIKFIKNHKLFNKDILFYKDDSHNAYVYYDNITLQYLGYSSDNIELKTTKNIRSITIKLSVKDMLQTIGYENRYIQMNNKNILNDTVMDIVRNRINNIKQMIVRSKSIIYNINNKGVIISVHNINEKQIINDFTKKIQKINMKNNTIFENIKYISNGLTIKDIPEDFKLHVINNYVDINNFTELNNIDNYLLYYLLSNFNNILDANNNIDICELIIRIIQYLFNLYHIPYTNYHIQKFNTLLFIDTPYIDDTFKPYGYYQELVTDEELSNPERLDALYDEEQAKESLDIDDYEDEDDPDNDIDLAGEMMDGGFEE